MILSIIAVLVTFGVVIFIHELGHFLVCLALKVRVERFAFGLGPELLGFTRGETRYSVCAFPLGGFVKPAGEVLEDVTGKPDEYFSKPWYGRLAIVAAGPLMNYLLAWLLFAGLAYFKGIPVPSTTTMIGDVFIDYPAYQAGLRPDDLILDIDGKAVPSWQEMADIINHSADRELAVKFRRKDELRIIKVTPRFDKDMGKGLIGIAPVTEARSPGLWGAVTNGLYQDWYWTSYTVKELSKKIVRREKPDVAGPIGIISLVHRAAHSGMADFIFLIALISVAIGFFNLLPIPLLDGGHAALYLWEGATRKPITEKILSASNMVGFAFLILLLVFATYQDIARLIKYSRPRPDVDTSQPVTVSTVTVPSK